MMRQAKLRGLLMSVCCFVLATVPLQAAKREVLSVGDLKRSYYLFLPKNSSPEKRLPLVIAFHGGGGKGTSFRRMSGLEKTAEEYGFAVVFPNGTGPLGFLAWNSGQVKCSAVEKNIDDVGFVSALIDHLVAEKNIDPHRVYLTGMSNGAMMSYRVAAEIPEKIAAIAPVGGTLAIPSDALKLAVPIAHFHGTDDPHVPFGGGHGKHTFKGNSFASVEECLGPWKIVNNVGPDPVVTMLPDTADDGTRVEKSVFASPDDPERMILFTIHGGGHTWPGHPVSVPTLGVTCKDFDVNELIWEFFRKHSRP